MAKGGGSKFGAMRPSDFMEFLTLVPEGERQQMAALIERMSRVQTWDQLLELQMRLVAMAVSGKLPSSVLDSIGRILDQMLETLRARRIDEKQDRSMDIITAALEAKQMTIEASYTTTPQITAQETVIDMIPALPEVSEVDMILAQALGTENGS
jgi:hypothetical protein